MSDLAAIREAMEEMDDGHSCETAAKGWAALKELEGFVRRVAAIPEHRDYRDGFEPLLDDLIAEARRLA
jgi:hypothetical protein